MELEKTSEANRAFQIASQVASFMIDRLNGQPYIIDAGEPTPVQLELEYDDQYLNGVAELDTRHWDVV